MHAFAPKQKTTEGTGYIKKPENNRDNTAIKTADTHTLLQLQHSVGNRAVQRMLQREENNDQAPLQKKRNDTGLPDGLKKGIEHLSGYAMDDVKVHYNSNKPAQLNALAYTQGTAIHVAPGQEKHLPHEAWHVVQQKQGRVRPPVQMKDSSINDDAGLEKEADVMGFYTLNNNLFQTRVSANNHQLNVATIFSTSHQPIQRFGSEEHRSLGDQATGGALVNVGGGAGVSRFELTHGDVIALSGDYFLPDELMYLGAIPGNQGQSVGTRDEIIWALKVINIADSRFSVGGVWHGFVFPDEVKQAVEDRYNDLAAQNTSHFYAPSGRNTAGQPIRSSVATDESAFSTYREFHERALILAYAAGRTSGGDISHAMAMEAAAQHFLTDSFSAGHLRTPAKLIRTYWGGRYPLFWYNMLHKMALDTATRMNDIDTNPTTIIGTVQVIYETIIAQVNTIAENLPQITLGDLLSLIFHDFDNVMGLAVIGGRLFGDSHLDDSNSANITRIITQEAIIAGNHDVREAFALGGSIPSLSEAEVFQNVRVGTNAPADHYNAETYVPDLVATNPIQNWHAPDFETLWSQYMLGTSGPTIGDQITAAMAPGNEIRDKLDGLGREFPSVEQRSSGDLHPRRAYLEGFVQPLSREPRAGILSIIHWSPNYGLRDADRDDIALATGNELSTAGTLSGMTTLARAAYVRELIGGNASDDEEALVIKIFATAAAAERPIIYELVEEHTWNGDWIHGVLVADDDIWNALNKARLKRLRTLINAGVSSRH